MSLRIDYDIADSLVTNRSFQIDDTLVRSRDQGEFGAANLWFLPGGGGLSGDDTMKRAGLTPSFFAAMGKGKPAANPLKAALMQIAKRPIVLNLSLGDKPFAAIKSEIKDETIGSLLRMLESSNLHGALGGH